jgi:hypothetical protein
MPVNRADEELRQLVNLLNSERRNLVADTTRELFELMSEVEDVVRARQIDLDGNSVDFRDGIPYLCWQGFTKSEAARFRRIAEIFDRSKFSLRPLFENGWSFMWTPLENLDPKAQHLAEKLAAIQALAQSGLLSRVRRCVCGRWYVVERTDQKFHSGGCRQIRYVMSDAGRAKRREYMRKYRKNLKRFEEKGKKRANIQTVRARRVS